MVLSNKKKREIEILEYFAPARIKWGDKNEEDIKTYFNWSERGTPFKINTYTDRSYLAKLYWGKSRRDYQSKQWFEDLGMYVTLHELRQDLPSPVFGWFIKSFNLSVWPS